MEAPKEITLAPGGVIYCPTGEANGAPMRFDLGDVLRAEAREREISAVTRDKAKELAKHFNWAWREVMQMVSYLRRQRDLAETRVDEIEADLLLNGVSAVLEQKKLKDSADTRKAVLRLDPDRQKAADVLSQIKAVISYLEVKAKSFERNGRTVQEAVRGGGWEPSGSNPDPEPRRRDPSRTPAEEVPRRAEDRPRAAAGDVFDRIFGNAR